MACLECIPLDNGEDSVVLMEPRPFRPFKSSEEYLYAMKEDLAEWLQRLYPELNINVDNFMEVLEDGVALCKHANNVRKTAVAYKEKLAQQGKRRRKFSSHFEMPDRDVLYRGEVKPGSFFARDNIHNFITWCRMLGIYECLLFETDDLVLRKNEKSFILCLLEVARRGAKFGMPAPLLVQFEKEIDRELANEQAAQLGNPNEAEEEADSDDEFESSTQYGPQPQLVTNDLRSLDEMVRDLVEKCSCPTQFPMIRVSEGKYRIGDTKMLIFVRILRNHVMVRVGGGWDTLSHYLEKHDPCRCRAGHRTPVASKLSVNQQKGSTQMQVTYERSTQSPPASRRSSGASTTGTVPSRKNSSAGLVGVASHLDTTPNRFRSRQRSQSPSARTPNFRQRSQSPACNNSSFVRHGSGRFGGYNRNQSPAMFQTPPIVTSPSTNLDSLESNDSGVALGGSPRSRPRNRGAVHNNDQVVFAQPADAVNMSDSSSEVSDEGYRSTAPQDKPSANKDLKVDDPEDRPDSSCTQASSAESGVSTEGDETVRKQDNAKKSKIPLFESLRSMKISFGSGKKEPAASPHHRLSRSTSAGNDTSMAEHFDHQKQQPQQQQFSRNSLGRHSLRTSRGSPADYRYAPENDKRSKQNPKTTNTWNGRRNKERTPLSADLFAGPSASTPRNPATSRVNSRAASASPHSRRRFLGASSTPASPDANPGPPNWKVGPNKTYPKSQTSENLSSPAKMSPLLRDMLKDVEIDNDESILKRMEEIVNQYKARVEGILAAEGKTLDDNLDSIPNDTSLPVPGPTAPLVRRNSYDSSMGDVRTRVYPSPRKNLATNSPSKIPMPTFYRPKETCL